MNEQANKAFRDVLDKFVHIGNCYYNGKHHDNILNIFSDLEEEDKKLLLRGVHHIYSIVEFGVNAPDIQMGPRLSPAMDGDAEVSQMDYNSKLMIEMKFWFIKTFGILFLLSITGFVFFILYVTSGTSEGPERAANLFKIFGLLFN